MALMEEKFASLNELYERILPALNTKVRELKRSNIEFITAKDIWNYCIENKWSKKGNLRMYEIVDDILNVDILSLEIYLKKRKRNIFNNKE